MERFGEGRHSGRHCRSAQHPTPHRPTFISGGRNVKATTCVMRSTVTCTIVPVHRKEEKANMYAKANPSNQSAEPSKMRALQAIAGIRKAHSCFSRSHGNVWRPLIYARLNKGMLETLTINVMEREERKNSGVEIRWSPRF